jgi:hypothetical protein
VGHAVGLHALFGAFGFDDRMVRLLLAISFENISTGIAGAAFVAYMSGIVSRSHTAVQYALLSSLTFLIGSLGRGIAGEAFDLYGYATVFRYAAAAGWQWCSCCWNGCAWPWGASAARSVKPGDETGWGGRILKSAISI